MKKILLVLLSAAFWTVSSQAEAYAEIKVPSQNKPGDTVFIEIKEPDGYALYRLTYDGNLLDIFYLNGRLGALVGIDAGAKAGKKKISAVFEKENSVRLKEEKWLKINPRKFPAVKVKRPKLTSKQLARVTEEKKKIAEAFETITPYPLWTDSFVSPLAEETIVSKGGEFGLIRKSKLGNAQHGGVDFKGDVGAPVFAANKGEVVLSQEMLLEGKIVIIDHGVGFYTLYMHLDSITVKGGDTVGRGDKIGTLGNSGRSDGPHLHFEARILGAKINPERIINNLGDAAAKPDAAGEKKEIPAPSNPAEPIIKNPENQATTNQCGNLLPLIDEAKKGLENEGLSFITQTKTPASKSKNIGGKKHATEPKTIVVGKETVLAVLKQDCSIRLVRLETPLSQNQPKNGFTIWKVTPQECVVEKISGGGVNKNLKVFCDGFKEPVLAGAYLLDGKIKKTADIKSIKPVIYSPYSDALALPEIINEGFSYLTQEIRLAKNELLRLGAHSRAIPKKMVAEIFEDWMIYRLSVIEHVDHDEFKKFGPGFAEKKVLTQLGLNREETFRYAESRTGALCLMQIMPGTYADVRKNYPEAKLPKNFYEGACGSHITAIMAAYLVLDYKLFLMPSLGMPADFKEKFLQDQLTYGVILAAAYNGGSEAAVKLYKKTEPSRLRQILANLFSLFSPKKREFRIIREETWIFIKKFCDIGGCEKKDNTEN